MSEPWPTELKVVESGRVLQVTFDTGESFALTAELLRVESPSAEVRGHGPGQEQLVFGKQMVSIAEALPVGNYALRLKFSDGHSTGIYTWPYLAKLGREYESIWRAYLEKLKTQGHSRTA